MATAERRAAVHDGHVPSPPSERRAWMLACGLALLAHSLVELSNPNRDRQRNRQLAERRLDAKQVELIHRADDLDRLPYRKRFSRTVGHVAGFFLLALLPVQRFIDQTQTHIPTRWMEGF